MSFDEILLEWFNTELRIPRFQFSIENRDLPSICAAWQRSIYNAKNQRTGCYRITISNYMSRLYFYNHDTIISGYTLQFSLDDPNLINKLQEHTNIILKYPWLQII